jgi:hypothetical protein
MPPVSPRPGPGRKIWHPAAESRGRSGGCHAEKRGFRPGRSHLWVVWPLWPGRCVGGVVDGAEAEATMPSNASGCPGSLRSKVHLVVLRL